MEPSAAPAPTRVWISSMKRMISPSRFWTSFSTAFRSVLELAPVLGTGHQGPEIEGDDLFVAQGLRDIAVDDALGQAFDDGGLADPGLADQYRVVLGAAGKDLDDPADFVVTADDRIELALAGDIGEVSGIFLQGLVLAFRVLVGDPLVAAHPGQGLQETVLGHPLALQHGADRPLVLEQGKKEMLLADILVLHGGGDLEGRIQHLLQLRRGIDLTETAAAHLGQRLDQLLGLAVQQGRIHPHLLEHRDHHPVRLLQQHPGEMLGPQFLVAILRGQFLSGLQGLL